MVILKQTKLVRSVIELDKKHTLIQRIKTYILNPAKYFEKCREEPSCAKHLGLLTLIAIARALISNQVNRQSFSQMNHLMISNQSHNDANNIVVNFLGVVNSPVAITIGAIAALMASYIISAGICYALIGKLFKGGKSYKHMMAVLAISGYPSAIYNLINGFLPKEADVSFVNELALTINVFTFWTFVLMIVGSSVVFEVPREKRVVVNVILFFMVIALNFINYSAGSLYKIYG